MHSLNGQKTRQFDMRFRDSSYCILTLPSTVLEAVGHQFKRISFRSYFVSFILCSTTFALSGGFYFAEAGGQYISKDAGGERGGGGRGEGQQMQSDGGGGGGGGRGGGRGEGQQKHSDGGGGGRGGGRRGGGGRGEGQQKQGEGGGTTVTYVHLHMHVHTKVKLRPDTR